jgi:hypothetical protein
VGDYLTASQFAEDLGVTEEAVRAWFAARSPDEKASGLFEVANGALVAVHVSYSLPGKRPSL